MSRRSSGAPRHPTAKLKGGWSPDEDALLTRLVKKFGEGNWSPIARALNEATGKNEATGRIGKQCRERWNHHLSPGLRKDPWTPEEEVMVVDAHKRLGNRWSDIARCIPGRSENAVKNHWNATLRKRVTLDNPAGPLKEYLDTLNLSVTPRKRGGSGGGASGAKRKRGARDRDSTSDEGDPDAEAEVEAEMEAEMEDSRSVDSSRATPANRSARRKPRDTGTATAATTATTPSGAETVAQTIGRPSVVPTASARAGKGAVAPAVGAPAVAAAAPGGDVDVADRRVPTSTPTASAAAIAPPAGDVPVADERRVDCGGGPEPASYSNGDGCTADGTTEAEAGARRRSRRLAAQISNERLRSLVEAERLHMKREAEEDVEAGAARGYDGGSEGESGETQSGNLRRRTGGGGAGGAGVAGGSGWPSAAAQDALEAGRGGGGGGGDGGVPGEDGDGAAAEHGGVCWAESMSEGGSLPGPGPSAAHRRPTITTATPHRHGGGASPFSHGGGRIGGTAVAGCGPAGGAPLWTQPCTAGSVALPPLRGAGTASKAGPDPRPNAAALDGGTGVGDESEPLCREAVAPPGVRERPTGRGPSAGIRTAAAGNHAEEMIESGGGDDVGGGGRLPAARHSDGGAAARWQVPYNWSTTNMQTLATSSGEGHQHTSVRAYGTRGCGGGKVRPPGGRAALDSDPRDSEPDNDEDPATFRHSAAAAAVAATAAPGPAAAATPAAAGAAAGKAVAAPRGSAEEDETCLFLSPAADFSASLGMRHVASGSALLSYEAAAAVPPAPQRAPAPAPAPPPQVKAPSPDSADHRTGYERQTQSQLPQHQHRTFADAVVDGAFAPEGLAAPADGENGPAGPTHLWHPRHTLAPAAVGAGGSTPPVRTWTPPNLFDEPHLDFGCPDSPLLHAAAAEAADGGAGEPSLLGLPAAAPATAAGAVPEAMRGVPGACDSSISSVGSPLSHCREYGREYGDSIRRSTSGGAAAATAAAAPVVGGGGVQGDVPVAAPLAGAGAVLKRESSFSGCSPQLMQAQAAAGMSLLAPPSGLLPGQPTSPWLVGGGANSAVPAPGQAATAAGAGAQPLPTAPASPAIWPPTLPPMVATPPTHFSYMVGQPASALSPPPPPPPLTAFGGPAYMWHQHCPPPPLPPPPPVAGHPAGAIYGGPLPPASLPPYHHHHHHHLHPAMYSSYTAVQTHPPPPSDQSGCHGRAQPPQSAVPPADSVQPVAPDDALTDHRGARNLQAGKQQEAHATFQTRAIPASLAGAGEPGYSTTYVVGPGPYYCTWTAYPGYGNVYGPMPYLTGMGSQPVSAGPGPTDVPAMSAQAPSAVYEAHPSVRHQHSHQYIHQYPHPHLHPHQHAAMSAAAHQRLTQQPAELGNDGPTAAGSMNGPSAGPMASLGAPDGAGALAVPSTTTTGPEHQPLGG